jgi:hypothetical protein
MNANVFDSPKGMRAKKKYVKSIRVYPRSFAAKLSNYMPGFTSSTFKNRRP